MNNLYLMVGAQGSGKSTYAREFREEHTPSPIIVSRDAIRFSMVKDGSPYFSKEKAVFKEFIREINEGLDKGDVIADATHINEVSRMKLINKVDLSKCKVSCIVVNTDETTAIKRNHLREGRARVPDSVISENYARFTHPKTDKFHYDKIIEIGDLIQGTASNG